MRESGAARPVALELKAKPTVNHPPTDGCYHVAKTRTRLQVGTCFEMDVILLGSEPGRKKDAA
jgi:hypothetical protein